MDRYKFISRNGGLPTVRRNCPTCADDGRAHDERMVDIMMKELNEKKSSALQAYKSAKAAYISNMTPENWKAFCDAKMVCMRLGVLI